MAKGEEREGFGYGMGDVGEVVRLIMMGCFHGDFVEGLLPGFFFFSPYCLSMRSLWFMLQAVDG